MAIPIIMPRQGQSVESCVITKWYKQRGDSVSEGELLFTYETDKATFDEESKASGTLLAAFFEEGDDVPVLTNVCVIGNEGEDANQFAPAGVHVQEPAQAAPVAPEAPPAAQPPQASPISGAPDAGAFASPRARALASRMGVNPLNAAPTGPGGRIIERDIKALASSGVIAARAGTVQPAVSAAPEAIPVSAAQPQPIEYADMPLSGVRRAIAKSMTLSLSTIPQLTHHLTFDATDILAYRKRLKDSGEALGLSGVTIGDMLLFAVSRVLNNHSDLNAHYISADSPQSAFVRRFKDVHLGFAVDTPRGLLVPTIAFANRLSLLELSAACKELAQAAQTGSIAPEKLGGASFTVSNLGAVGIEMFTPVINPPQTGILGVNTVTDSVRINKEGALEGYKSMGLSLTYDHRAVDGAPASRFLVDLKKALEGFTLLLAK